MHFIYPHLLWVLAALVFPIIIHLFHFRRFKKVYFTNVKFLKEIKEEKSARNKLRNFLVLLSRLFAFAFLIFAFAQPFLSNDDSTKTGKNYISIFIDNSNSMVASSEDVPLLDKAKKKAEEIVMAYGPSDQFQVISHELKGAQLRWLNQENTISAIDGIELNPEVNLLSNIFNKQKESSPDDGNHILYYLSDFQKSITDLSLDIDTTLEINLLPFQSIKENNIAIDSAWFESVVPSINQNNKLLVRVKNHSAEKKEDVRISLIQNGQSRPEGTIDIGGNSSKIDTINLLFSESGWQNIEIKIDDYPIQFDDSYYLSFNIKKQLNVLSINENRQDKFLAALFKGLNQFDLTDMSLSNIQYDQLKDNDLIILSGLNTISSGLSSALKTYTENGGNVIVFPSPKVDLGNYNNFLSSMNANSITEWTDVQRNVYQINTAEFIFQDVYESISSNLRLPITTGNYNFTNFSSRGGEYLLKYRDGNHYISKYNLGKGHFYICASPLDISYNDLTINAEVFVPLLYKLSFSSFQTDKLAYSIGIDNFTEIANNLSSNDIIYKITGDKEFIPGQTNLGAKTLINFNNMITVAGHYNLELNGNIQKALAFNYDRLESNLDYLNQNELKEKFEGKANILENIMEADLTAVIKEKDKGITLWRSCLILVLLFLAIETLLLRFWKV